MNTEDIKKKLIEVICEETGYPEDAVNEGMNLESDLGMDSIKKVEILSKVSEEYGINWEDIEEDKTEELGNIETVGEIITFIEGLKA